MVPFASYVSRGQSKPRLTFSRINGPNVNYSSREIFTKKSRQQQNFDSDPKEAWHYNQVTFTPITKNFMLYCRLIYMLSMLYIRLMIKVKVGISESFKVGWYPHKITGSSHLNMRTWRRWKKWRQASASMTRSTTRKTLQGKIQN